MLSKLAAFITILLLMAAGSGHCREAAANHILFLNSYHDGYKGSDNIVSGFSAVLKRSFPDAEIKIEYLDSKNFSGPDYDAQVLELLRRKYLGNNFELIVSSDDYAFNILERCRDELFAKAPIIFCGTNSFDIHRLDGKKGIIGIDEAPSFRESIELIFRLNPAIRHVVVIHDDSITGQINSQSFREEAVAFSQQAQFEYVAGAKLEALQERIKKLSPDSVVFYFASFVLDRDGESFRSERALEILARQSPVPIYGGWEFNLGYGILGGKLVNLTEHGALAGKLAARVLGGEPLAALPLLSPSPNQYMFDDRELRHFSIKDFQLPPGSIIVNRPPTFFQSYRAEIFISISLFLACLVVWAFLAIYRSRAVLKGALQEQMTTAHSLDVSQRELGQALGFSQSLLQAVPLPVFYKTQDGHYLGCNQAFTELTGVAETQLKGKTVYDLWPQTLGDLYQGRDQELLTGRLGHQSYEGVLLDYAGHRRNVIFHKRYFGNQDETIGIVGVVVDITERKEAEQELQDINQTLGQRVKQEIKTRLEQERMLVQQAKMAAMGEMIGAIAHQWRQPLNSVGIIIQDIKDAFRNGDLDQSYLDRSVDETMRQVTFMSKTIDDFRNFFKPDKERVVFDMKRTATEVLALLSSQLHAKNICWRLNCHAHNKSYGAGDEIEFCQEMTVAGFPNEMKQVFLNLIANAADAILACRQENDAGNEEGNIQLDFSHEGDTVVARILDNGGGVPEAIFDRIFEPYYTTKEQGRGTGIGLYMAKMIVENNMGGQLTMQNKDAGAEFIITIPVTPNERT